MVHDDYWLNSSVEPQIIIGCTMQVPWELWIRKKEKVKIEEQEKVT